MYWTITGAAIDFGVSKETLLRGLRLKGFDTSKKGRKYTTQEICSVIFGGICGERLLKLRAERELLEMERATKSGDLLPKAEVEAYFRQCWTPVSDKLREMPRALAARTNPSDPVFSESVLRQWVTENLVCFKLECERVAREKLKERKP